MTNIKLLIGINKNLSNALTNTSNLNDCINKHCWQDIIEDLIKDISQAIEYEKTINK
jgi:hypothetical protein